MADKYTGMKRGLVTQLMVAAIVTSATNGMAIRMTQCCSAGAGLLV